MVWLWSSWDEYVSNIDPQCVTSRGILRQAQRESSFEVVQRLFKAAATLERSISGLHALGFRGGEDGNDLSVNADVYRHVEDLLYAGEELLLFHKRLALSAAAYDFACCRDVLQRWDRNLGTPRAAEEINELVRAIRTLMDGFFAITKGDTELLVGDLELPEDLESDFRLARNLFSVGFDDVAALISGRGLEGVLREIARRRKMLIVIKGVTEPAAEVDLHDLIEVLYRVRWKASGKRLISSQTRGLLQYLRTVRNTHAHASSGSTLAESDPRETAIILSRTANRLWKDATATRARLVPTTVPKNW
jgi:hypothetical protein